MSQENVEVVRRVYKGFTRNDESWRELVAPEFVIDFSRRKVDPFVFRGRDDPALATFRRELADVWVDPPTWEPQELIDAGDNVFAVIRTVGTGKASGVEVEAHVVNVWTFRDGTPVELMYFGEDRQAALEAVGLPE